MKRLLIVISIAGILALGACGAGPTPAPTEVPPTEAPSAPTLLPASTPTDTTFESPLPIGTAGDEALQSPLGLPNPASQFCIEEGYDLEMRTEAAGTAGYCIFPDGSECEEWAFYRGECAPGTPAP